MSRYYQLIDIIREKRPKHILEIGTWSGKRAKEFMAVCDCYYTGFDLFEDITTELAEKELNIKRPHSIADVGKGIEMAGFNKFCLIRGDTNQTLPEYFAGKPAPFDFAFIDGGHSEKTIENDFKYIAANIEKGGTIILDDWYDPQIPGYGCNLIDGEVLPSQDLIWGTIKTKVANARYDGTVHLLKVQM